MTTKKFSEKEKIFWLWRAIVGDAIAESHARIIRLCSSLLLLPLLVFAASVAVSVAMVTEPDESTIKNGSIQSRNRPKAKI